MTDYSLRELADAEVVPDVSGSNTWLLRFGPNEYDTVNKTAKNTLIVKKDAIDPDTSTYTVGSVTVEIDFDDDEYVLHRGTNEALVPPERQEHVLWSIYDDDAQRIAEIFDDIYEETVRVGVMDWFRPRFTAEITKGENGWLVDGALVRWNGENAVASVDDTYEVSGGEAVPADDQTPALRLTEHWAGEATAQTPNGREIDLSETERRFLATVALLSDDYGSYGDGLDETVEQTDVDGFTDTKSGLYHGHDRTKHTLGQLGVTDEAQERLWYNSHDHAGVHELSVRRDEFENAPIDVFEDAANDDPDKWSKISLTSEKAPIPQSVRDDLESRY